MVDNNSIELTNVNTILSIDNIISRKKIKDQEPTKNSESRVWMNTKTKKRIVIG